MPSLDAAKRDLRDEIRRKLPAPGTPAHVAASVAAQERLASTPLALAARMVGLYRALPSECGTASLAAALQSLGKEICYPAVAGGTLQFRRPSDVFARGALGVEEPTGPSVELAAIDLLVVPAIAVDARGRRLGRGKGFYDATLARFAAVSVALVFDAQLVPEVPVDEHDRSVTWVCTEARLLRTSE